MTSDIWRLSLSCFYIGLRTERKSARMSKITNDWLNAVWYGMLYSCTHMAAVGVIGLHRWEVDRAVMFVDPELSSARRVVVRPCSSYRLPDRGRDSLHQRDVHRRRVCVEPCQDNEPGAAGLAVTGGRRGAGRRPHLLHRIHHSAAHADPSVAVSLSAHRLLYLFQHRMAN